MPQTAQREVVAEDENTITYRENGKTYMEAKEKPKEQAVAKPAAAPASDKFGWQGAANLGSHLLPAGLALASGAGAPAALPLAALGLGSFAMTNPKDYPGSTAANVVTAPIPGASGTKTLLRGALAGAGAGAAQYKATGDPGEGYRVGLEQAGGRLLPEAFWRLAGGPPAAKVGARVFEQEALEKAAARTGNAAPIEGLPQPSATSASGAKQSPWRIFLQRKQNDIENYMLGLMKGKRNPYVNPTQTNRVLERAVKADDIVSSQAKVLSNPEVMNDLMRSSPPPMQDQIFATWLRERVLKPAVIPVGEQTTTKILSPPTAIKALDHPQNREVLAAISNFNPRYKAAIEGLIKDLQEMPDTARAFTKVKDMDRFLSYHLDLAVRRVQPGVGGVAAAAALNPLEAVIRQMWDPAIRKMGTRGFDLKMGGRALPAVGQAGAAGLSGLPDVMGMLQGSNQHPPTP